MNYYRRYMGSYQKKTMRLSPTDHGVYDLMLDYCYAEESPLPLEIDDIHTICKATKPDHRASVAKVLGLYFIRMDDGYHNERADEEIAISRQARTNGKAHTGNGTGKVTGKPTGNGTGMATESITGDATESATGKGGGNGSGLGHPSAFSLQPKTKTKPRRAAKTPLPADFCVSERVQKWAEDRGIDQLKAHLIHFVGYAKANGKTYTDWDQAFENAIRDDWAKVRSVKP